MCVLSQAPAIGQQAHIGSSLPNCPTGLLIAQISELWATVQPLTILERAVRVGQIGTWAGRG